MSIVLIVLYSYLAIVATSNWLLMKRPKANAGLSKDIVVLIPARDEESNLKELLPQLVPFAKAIVFNDESTDKTGEVASELGATVITPPEPLPKGWTGKNRACHELGLVGLETEAEYLLFLDADVRVTPDFFPALQNAIETSRPNTGCITAFPFIVPGRFPQPLFLAWVGWILLATIPFGLINRSGIGHSRFTNGQITLWKRDVWANLRPNEQAKNRVLEDVVIGRLLASRKIGTEVIVLADVMSVKMYDTAKQTIDGMSKNSFEIMNSYPGTIGLSIFLLFVSWGWVLNPVTLILFAISGVASFAICQRKGARQWLAPSAVFMPIIVSIGALTLLRSLVWKVQKRTAWKGRIYP